MKIHNFTIKATVSLDCQIVLDEKISKRKLEKMIANNEVHPHILSENCYDFHGYTLTCLHVYSDDDEEKIEIDYVKGDE